MLCFSDWITLSRKVQNGHTGYNVLPRGTRGDSKGGFFFSLSLSQKKKSRKTCLLGSWVKVSRDAAPLLLGAARARLALDDAHCDPLEHRARKTGPRLRQPCALVRDAAALAPRGSLRLLSNEDRAAKNSKRRNISRSHINCKVRVSVTHNKKQK